ncbi:MAG: DUF3592 domain-containing protein [Pseudomonadota bacterium]|nr:DUF3592 domain-containing protein [Pseudomonadota bacterium]
MRLPLNFIDKVWILAAVIAGLVSYHISVNDIPHYNSGQSPHWPFLALISSLVVLSEKLRRSGIVRLPDAFFMLILGSAIFFLMFHVVDSRYRAKSILIYKSPALVTGVVVRADQMRTKGFESQRMSIGLSVVYRYSVSGKEYVEADGVADNAKNREAYRQGMDVVIRYALKDPSVSEIADKEPRAQ